MYINWREMKSKIIPYSYPIDYHWCKHVGYCTCPVPHRTFYVDWLASQDRAASSRSIFLCRLDHLKDQGNQRRMTDMTLVRCCIWKFTAKHCCFPARPLRPLQDITEIYKTVTWWRNVKPQFKKNVQLPSTLDNIYRPEGCRQRNWPGGFTCFAT